MRLWIAALGLAVAAVGGALVGEATRSVPDVAHFDGPEFESVESLARAADVIAVGLVGQRVGDQVDFGGDPAHRDAQSGIPVAFYEFEPSAVIKGDLPRTATLTWLDTDRLYSDQQRPIRNGQQLLLFLREETSESAPGIVGISRHFTPIGMDQGVFDVTGASATQRWVPASEGSAIESRKVSIEEVRQIAAGR